MIEFVSNCFLRSWTLFKSSYVVYSGDIKNRGGEGDEERGKHKTAYELCVLICVPENEEENVGRRWTL